MLLPVRAAYQAAVQAAADRGGLVAGLVGGLVQSRNSHPHVPTGSAGRALDFQVTRSPLVGLPLPNPSQRPAVRVAFSNRPKCTSYQLKCTKRMSKLAGGWFKPGLVAMVRYDYLKQS